MYVCMCNPLCTCMYNIQKYKTQISTYAIFVRSHFLVQAIYHNKIHCIIQTQKSEKGTETTSHTPEKQQRKPKKTIQAWENTEPYFIHIPNSNSTPSNERNIMYGSAIICVFIYEIIFILSWVSWPI